MSDPYILPLEQRLSGFINLGKHISGLTRDEISAISQRAKQENAWFTEESISTAFQSLSLMLSEKSLRTFVAGYPGLSEVKQSKTIGVISAGNIPAVGFHDVLCVLLSGHQLQVKLSKSDSVMMKYLLTTLADIEPEYRKKFEIADRMAGMQAVICTGSDNSARYFESYFGKYPHIIRKNRTSVAVLDGNESSEDIRKLGTDVFTYFGLGCRNVAKVFIPEKYEITELIDSFECWSQVINQHKYANNYTYSRAIMMMNLEKYLDNNFLLLKETEQLHSPIAVLYYQRYSSLSQVTEIITAEAAKIQCVVTNIGTINTGIPFGKTQFPELSDFADGVDTIKFLLGL